MFVRAASGAGNGFVLVLKRLAVPAVVYVVMAFRVAAVADATSVVFIPEEVAKS